MSDAAVASLRLDDALREYLFERGTRNVPLEALTALTNGAGRIRMTAEAVAELTPVADPGQSNADALTGTAGAARDWFEHLADRLELHRRNAPPLPAPAVPIAERTVLADARDSWADHPVADQPVADQPVAAVRPGRLADGRTLWMAALYLDNLHWLQRRLVAPSDELDGKRAGRTLVGPPRRVGRPPVTAAVTLGRAVEPPAPADPGPFALVAGTVLILLHGLPWWVLVLAPGWPAPGRSRRHRRCPWSR